MWLLIQPALLLGPGSRTQLPNVITQLPTARPRATRLIMMEYQRGDDGGAPIDESLVSELIAARTSLRQARNFKAADNVREDLRRMGVSLWDRDRMWTVGDSPPSATGAETSAPQRGVRRDARVASGRGSGRQSGGGRAGGGSNPDERTRIFVEGLSTETTWQTLKV